jgi:hypothetical protein
VVRQLAGQIDLPVDIGPLVRDAVQQEGALQEELKGVSVGTALAYVLYQRGAVLVPRGDPVGRLRVERPNSEQSAWPIGYPDSRQAAGRIPRLLDFLPVAIHQTPLPTVLTALEQRLEVPMLLDRPAMAQRGIRMNRVLVTLPEEKTYYKKVLDQALFQARLQAQVRLDDAGRPLLWITTIGPPSSDGGP